MPTAPVIRLARSDEGVASQTLHECVARLQSELKVTPEFPAEVEAVAEAAAKAPRLPVDDRTALPFVTLDPASSRDLDQALHLAREGEGYVVHYAIADVAAFVAPGDALDVEVNQRGETLYGADEKIPLHPLVLSEGAASLLPDEARPAILWTLHLDATGEFVQGGATRAVVKSVAKLDYEGLQKVVDGGALGSLPEAYRDSVSLLPVIGRLREEREVARGGVNLPLPEQEVVVEGSTWSLTFRRQSAVEGWNAQLSLLTGIAAARLMVDAKIGLLRTVPPAQPDALDRLRLTAKALKVDWPDQLTYPEFVRSLDSTIPAQAAMVVACAKLLRGSGHVTFDGTVPEQIDHAAVAAPYAHVTAPLRRLADRYASEIAVALTAGQPVPEWVRTALPGLSETMRRSSSRAGAYTRGITDLVEAAILTPFVGRAFDGVVVSVGDKEPTRGTVTIAEPAVEGSVTSAGPLPVGERVVVTLAEADVSTRRIAFTL